MALALLDRRTRECRRGRHRDREVEFIRAGMTFPGTLEYPAGAVRLPAVVLVHGSGPNDRDETLHDGPVELRPFRELSQALASLGFVVLRYDKRSYLLGKYGNLAGSAALLPQDYIEDARAAIEFLRAQPEVDAERILLVGHSQGASLAPWVAEGEGLFGAVLLAPGLLATSNRRICRAARHRNGSQPWRSRFS
ncbi:MAG: alpha/beta fold hydrolase [Armatimonadetes bacterium]|nr:alpha/beta fold hydrolase [Armatimonadota bacterium]